MRNCANALCDWYSSWMESNETHVILGAHPGWLHDRGLPVRLTAPPTPTLASSRPLSSAHFLWASLGGDAVFRGPPEPAWLGPSLTLHERWWVLLTPPADGGGENGGLVPEHGERSRGEWSSRREWVLKTWRRSTCTMGNSSVSKSEHFPSSSWAYPKCSRQRPDAYVSKSPAVLPSLPAKCGKYIKMHAITIIDHLYFLL